VKNLCEKNPVLRPKMTHFPHKMGQNGTIWGGLGGPFWVFKASRPFGTSKKVILKGKKFRGKKIFGPKNGKVSVKT